MQYPSSRVTVQLHDTSTPPPLPESRTYSASEEELEDSTSVVEDESQEEKEAQLSSAEVNERLPAALVKRERFRVTRMILQLSQLR